MGIKLKYLGGPGDFDEHEISVLNEFQKLAFSHAYVKPNANHWWQALDTETGADAGFCCLYQYPSRPDTAFLSLAAVTQKYRGFGIQRRMIRVRVRKAKQLGCQRAISYTSNDNIHSANNLWHCGFRLYLPTWEWGVHDALYFRKYL